MKDKHVLDSGVWGVLATPFGSTGTVDHASLARLATHYERVGCVGATVLGVFGEAMSLSSVEKRDVLKTVASSCRLPLTVGVTALATAPACEEIDAAKQVLDERMVAAMVQINTGSRTELRDHFNAINAATGVRIVAQDYPVASHVTVDVATIGAVVGECAALAAVKAESPPTTRCIREIARAGRVPVFGGLGGMALLDELEIGAAGAMTGFSFPEGLIACVEAFRRGGYMEARQALEPYLPLIYFEAQPGIGLAIRKESLRRRGLIDTAFVRVPGRALDPGSGDLLTRHLAATPHATDIVT